MHELNYIWTQYFWASLKGNGPEALVQTVAYGIIALIVIPPLRHWVSDHVKGIHAKLNAQHEEHLRLVENNHAQHIALLKKQHAEVLKHVVPKTPIKKPPLKVVPKENNANQPAKSPRP